MKNKIKAIGMSLAMAGISFPVSARVASALDDVDEVTLQPDPRYKSRNQSILPIMEPSDFILSRVEDPEKGN